MVVVDVLFTLTSVVGTVVETVDVIVVTSASEALVCVADSSGVTSLRPVTSMRTPANASSTANARQMKSNGKFDIFATNYFKSIPNAAKFLHTTINSTAILPADIVDNLYLQKRESCSWMFSLSSRVNSNAVPNLSMPEWTKSLLVTVNPPVLNFSLSESA